LIAKGKTLKADKTWDDYKAVLKDGMQFMLMGTAEGGELKKPE